MLFPVENQPDMNSFKDQVAVTVAAHDFFAREKPIWVARAPGRLDVMGGNVDYTGGMVLQSLLREAETPGSGVTRPALLGSPAGRAYLLLDAAVGDLS